MAWAEEHKKIAISLWENGFSASDIAARIVDGDGREIYSRNAVIGVLYRMPNRPRRLEKPKNPRKQRMNRKASPGAAIQANSSLAIRAPAPARTKSFTSSAPRGLRVKSLEQLRDRDCRWPFGEGEDMRYCGRRQCRGSYCEEHAAIAYVPKASRKTGGRMILTERTKPARPVAPKVPAEPSELQLVA